MPERTASSPLARMGVLPAFVASVAVSTAGWWGLRMTGPVDDAYITMTYARNLAAGRGIVFNPGEIVEGCTAFLHMALLAGFAKFGVVRLDVVSILLGITAWAATFALAFRLWRTHRQGHNAPIAGWEWVVVAFLLTGPIGLVWSTAAMETPLVAFLWTLGLTAHLREVEGGRLPWISALATVAAGLMRPDGILLAVPLGLSWLRPWKKKRVVLGVAYGAMVLALFGGYWLWRWSYFGYPVPNTFAAKVGSPGPALFGKGLLYLALFAGTSAFPVAFAYLFARDGRAMKGELPRWFFVAVGMMAVLALYVLGVGGDFFPYYRFLAPAYLPFGFACLAFFRRWADKHLGQRTPVATPKRRRTRLVAILGAWWLFATAGWFLDYYKACNLVRWTDGWRRVGVWLSLNTPEDAVIATLPIGAIGYYSHRRVIDMVGLTNVEVGRAEIPTGAKIVGHEKYNSEYILGERPDLILTWPVLMTRYPRTAADWHYRHTIAYAQQDIYLHPETWQFYSPTTAKIGKRRLMGLMRKDRFADPAWRGFTTLPHKRARMFFNAREYALIRKPTYSELREKIKEFLMHEEID
ncbi:MAG: hypothetical protein H6684_12620 [Deltaproteobacteria bacterium]|nr:hypothetical protein [Deltaproteobacteria bacterium]